MYKLIALIISLVVAKFVTPQEFYGISLDHKKGLLSKECYDIEYDENGYLIVCTQFGIMKFNGTKFEAIALNSPFKSRIFYDLELTKSYGLVGFNSNNQIFQFKNDCAYKLFDFNILKSKKYIQLLRIEQYKNGVLIYTNELTYYLNIKSRKISTLSDFSDNKTPCQIKIDESNLLLTRSIQKNEHIKVMNFNLIFQNSNQSFKIKSKVQFDNYSRDAIIRIKNSYFVVANNQLFKYHGGKLNKIGVEQVLFIKYIHKKLWALSRNGLIELDCNGKVLHTHFKGKIVAGIVPFGRQGLILSFNRNGILFIRDISERKYDILKLKQIVASPDECLIQTNENKIFTLKKDKLEYVYDMAIPFKKINNTSSGSYIQFDNKFHQWLFFNGKGIVSVDTSFKTSKISTYPSNKKFLYTPKFVFRNEFQTISFASSAIVQIAPKAKFITTNASEIFCFEKLNNHQVLYGTKDGVYTLNTVTFKTERFILNSQIESIRKLIKYGNSVYILTHFNGIFKYNLLTKKVERISTPTLSSNNMLIHKGKIYICGNSGVFLLKNWSESEWIQLFDDEVTNFQIIKQNLIIQIEDAIITKNIGAILAPQSILFKLKYFAINKKRNNSILNSPLPFASEIQFQFDIVNFESDRNGIYYILQGDRTFRKRTEGTILNFDALESGTYDLTVYPTSDNQINFSKPLRFKFEIEKPYWQTWLFYTIALLILSLLIYILRLLFIIRKKKRQSERNRLESQLNEYKLLAVKAQVNPHFLSNGFAAVQALILKNETEKAAQYLAKFSLFMRRILYYSESQFITVKEELDIIDLYIDLEQLRFKDKFIVKHDIQLTDQQLNNWKVPALLLQPIVENAIWHGLKNSSEHPMLSIRMNAVSNHQLHIEIEDNGPGIEPHKQRVNHMSKGNRLIQDRIDALHKQFSLEAAKFELQSSNHGTKAIFDFSSAIIEHH